VVTAILTDEQSIVASYVLFYLVYKLLSYPGSETNKKKETRKEEEEEATGKFKKIKRS
jgi:hypothetical protein